MGDESPPPGFVWPNGTSAAVSLTFDDARPSQVDRGVPILDAHGLRATFYVSPYRLEERLEGWRTAVVNGHEIGNHSLSHPCSANFPFARAKAIEDLTVAEMESDILEANRQIREALGITPRTFAYPCGQTYVGRGTECRSYVPVVAEHFVVGRAAFNERHSSPAHCDLAQVFGMDMDCRPLRYLMALAESAVAENGWLVLFGHDVRFAGRQAVRSKVLDAFCNYIAESAETIWCAPVAEVGEFVARSTKEHDDVQDGTERD